MVREYYDHANRCPTDPAGRPLTPASKSQQDAYWLLRSRRAAAIAEAWPDILADHPEIALADYGLEAFLKVHHTRAFLVFRPEDASITEDARSPRAFTR